MWRNLRPWLIADKTRYFLPVFAVSPNRLHEFNVIDRLPCRLITSLFAFLSLLRSFDVSPSQLLLIGLSLWRELDNLLLFKQTMSLGLRQRCDEQFSEGELKILDWLLEQGDWFLFKLLESRWRFGFAWVGLGLVGWYNFDDFCVLHLQINKLSFKLDLMRQS